MSSSRPKRQSVLPTRRAPSIDSASPFVASGGGALNSGTAYSTRFCFMLFGAIIALVAREGLESMQMLNSSTEVMILHDNTHGGTVSRSAAESRLLSGASRAGSAAASTTAAAAAAAAVTAVAASEAQSSAADSTLAYEFQTHAVECPAPFASAQNAHALGSAAVVARGAQKSEPLGGIEGVVDELYSRPPKKFQRSFFVADAAQMPPTKRKRKPGWSFSIPAVDAIVDEMKGKLKDKALAYLFENCYPNTIDTTVKYTAPTAELPFGDAFVITGDIHALWLRDSTNQVMPYLRFERVAKDDRLRALVRALIQRQARSILLNPYCNSFLETEKTPASEWRTDRFNGVDANGRQLSHLQGVHECKYELDSLAAFFRLSHTYFEVTGETEVFDDTWLRALKLAMQTVRYMQKGTYDTPLLVDVQKSDTLAFGVEPQAGADGKFNVPPEILKERRPKVTASGSYSMNRNPGSGGRKYEEFPTATTGLSKSYFRPSDDGSFFMFPVAANAMAGVALARTCPLLAEHTAERDECVRLADQLDTAARAFGVIYHPVHGMMYAYEVDGLGGSIFYDDANVPSLLSLPYLGFCKRDDPIYLNTRRAILSNWNQYYYSGTAGHGVGSPHTVRNSIWPIGLIIQAMTSNDDAEIKECLDMLINSEGGTGFMHESFNADNPKRFTRAWFAWANSLFGELIMQIADERPHLLFQ